jgi:hypothetical protein
VTADSPIDPDTAQRIDRYTDDLIASWPPLTEQQKDTIASILRGTRIRLAQRSGGGNDAA